MYPHSVTSAAQSGAINAPAVALAMRAPTQPKTSAAAPSAASVPSTPLETLVRQPANDRQAALALLRHLLSRPASANAARAATDQAPAPPSASAARVALQYTSAAAAPAGALDVRV